GADGGATVPGAVGFAASGAVSVGAGRPASFCGAFGVPKINCQPSRTAIESIIAINRFFWLSCSMGVSIGAVLQNDGCLCRACEPVFRADGKWQQVALAEFSITVPAWIFPSDVYAPGPLPSRPSGPHRLARRLRAERR